MIEAYKIILVLVVIVITKGVFGEAIYYPPGKAPKITLEQKIKHSQTDAKVIVVGKFLPLSIDLNSTHNLSIDEVFVAFNFVVSEVIFGDELLQSKTLSINLPILTPDNISNTRKTSKDKTINYSNIASKILKLERDLESKSLEKDAYLAQLKSLCNTIINSKYYISNYVLIPVEIGGVDVGYRSAVVPVSYGDIYILLLFRSNFYKNNDVFNFLGEFDLYPDSDLVRTLLRKNTAKTSQ